MDWDLPVSLGWDVWLDVHIPSVDLDIVLEVVFMVERKLWVMPIEGSYHGEGLVYGDDERICISTTVHLPDANKVDIRISRV